MQKEHINRICYTFFFCSSMWVCSFGFLLSMEEARSPHSSAELGETRRPTKGIRLKSRALRCQTNDNGSKSEWHTRSTHAME